MGVYSDKKASTLAQIEDSKYESAYQPQIESTANQIANYGNYSSQYGDQISSAADKLSNWTYDPTTDPVYQAYQKQYTDAGNKAMKNTLGQIAARTGGMASTYAGSAAQQTYNGYMQQLTNMIPQLSDSAYNKAQNNLSMLQNLDATDYQRWQNALADLYNQNGMYLNMDANDLAHWNQKYNYLQDMYSLYGKLADEEEAAARGSGSGGYGYYPPDNDDDDDNDDDYINQVNRAIRLSTSGLGGLNNQTSWGAVTSAIKEDYAKGDIDDATKKQALKLAQQAKKSGDLK